LLTSNDQINANIIIQHEAQDVIHANRAATDDLPLQILTNQEDLRRIVQYQNAGQHVAEQIVEAGQRVSDHLLGIMFWPHAIAGNA
jgi:hypothetical protein